MSIETLTDALAETLAVFEEEAPGTPLTTAEVAAALDVGRRSTYDRLERLADRGRLETKAVGARGRVWWQSPLDETALGESDREFRSLVAAVEEYAIFMLNPEGRIQTWNDGARAIKGYATDEILGEHVSTFYTDDARAARVPERNLARAARDGSVEDEGWRVRADGSRFWANVTITAVRGDAGDIAGFTKVTRDMTERREREQALARQRDDAESELSAVFERVDDAFVALDDRLRFTYVNDRAAELLKRSAADLLGERADAAVPAIRETPVWPALEDAMETQKRREVTVRFDPLAAWIEARIYPSAEGLSVYFRDVTERTERERELKRYETIVETVEDGVYVLDEEFRFVMVNNAYVELTGYDRAELLGAPATKVVDESVTDESAELLADIAEGDGESASLEADVQRADGTTVRAESKFSALPAREGEQPHKVGVVRDISDRKERERELVTYETLFEESTDVNVVVDTDGTYQHITPSVSKVLGYEPEELLGENGFEYIHPEDREAAMAAFERLIEEPDYEPRVEFRFRHKDGDWVVLEALGRNLLDDPDIDGIVVYTRDVTERARRKETLQRRRRELEALNDLNRVVGRITEAITDQSTREEIEATVCRTLADADSYEFAWIGEVDPGTDEVSVRAQADAADYLADVTVSTDAEHATGRGPTGRAARTAETQVTQDVLSAPDYERWRDAAREHGVRSSAAIPIRHEDTLYGVLNVYAARPEAFSPEERAVVSRLGEVVGHAIASTERKRALMGDEVVEVQFRVRDVFDGLDVDLPADGRISLDEVVPTGEDTYLVYGSVTDGAEEALRAFAAATDHWGTPSMLDDGDGGFQLPLTEPPLFAVVASHGGDVRRARIEDGDFGMTIHLPPTVDVRRVVDAMEEAYPAAELVTRRQQRRSRPSRRQLDRVLERNLTDRQWAALAAAYHAGFFEWPRDSSGESIAEALGVAPPTFHQHLRTAERALLESVLDEPT